MLALIAGLVIKIKGAQKVRTSTHTKAGKSCAAPE